MSTSAPLDAKAHRVLDAIRCKRRPYTEADIAMASHLSKAVVRKRCQSLEASGLIQKRWVGALGPYWEIVNHGDTNSITG